MFMSMQSYCTSQAKQKTIQACSVQQSHSDLLSYYDFSLHADSNFMWQEPYNGQVRLVADTLAPSSGRVEVHQGNMWGTVCARDFGQAAADSVCRQLGYTGSAAISVASRWLLTSFSQFLSYTSRM